MSVCPRGRVIEGFERTSFADAAVSAKDEGFSGSCAKLLSGSIRAVCRSK